MSLQFVTVSFYICLYNEKSRRRQSQLSCFYTHGKPFWNNLETLGCQADTLPAERLEELNRALDEYILRALDAVM